MCSNNNIIVKLNTNKNFDNFNYSIIFKNIIINLKNDIYDFLFKKT